MEPWNLSCPDWKERLKAGKSLVPDLPLDVARADKAESIFNALRLADVPGTPQMKEAGGQWFKDIVRALFGSLDRATKQRMIRELFILVAKKNAKTSQGALLMLTALILNERPRATLIMTAPVHDVAQLAFDAVAGAIELDPFLEKRFHARHHVKTIIDRNTKAELQIMTFDPSVLTGQKPVATLIDELHVVAQMGKASSAIRQIRGGMLPFPEAFMAFITTQSEDPPAGVFAAELKTARAIRDGKQRGAMLPVMYEFPPEMQEDEEQWRDSNNWWMVTPNLGRSISIPRLIEDMHTAESKGREELTAWASQHLNIEIGVGIKTDSWAGAEFWAAQSLPALTLDEVIKRSEVLTIGIDGGGLDDMLGLAVIGRDPSGNWLHWGHAWMHPIALVRHKKDVDRYHDFEADGDLTICKQVGDDIDELVAYCQQCQASGLLDKIGLDPVGVGAILDALEEAGINKDQLVGVPQGWKMVGAIKSAERRLAERQFFHGGTRLMAWCVGNAKIEPRGNAVLITKQVAGSAKIDPLMALLDAVAMMGLNPAAKNRESVFFL